MSSGIQPTDRELFHSVEQTEPRNSAFLASVGAHIAMLSVALVIPLIFTETIRVKFEVTALAPPPPEPKPILNVTYYALPKPVRQPERQFVAPPPSKPLLAELRVPEPPKPVEITPPKIIEEPKPLPKTPAPPERPAEPPPPPKPAVRTNVFPGEPAKTTTTDLPARQVQTGGFGDPNGAPGKGRNDKPANIQSLGSFDLPVGEGAGNGTGGSKGVRGVTSNSGFGSGSSETRSRDDRRPAEASGRTVRQAGFGDTQEARPAGAARVKPEEPPDTPVEILFKPRPDYTDEARQRHIEGEVLIRVLFTASGEVRILEVTRSLGHGLDQNAIRAAEKIRFKPALRNKQPVDSTATVRIVFQLAN